MNLVLVHYAEILPASLGLLFVNSTFACYTLEGSPPSAVLPHRRIPDGVYEIRPHEILTPLTQTYRKRYPWFEWHLEVTGVPGRDHIYFHVGNTAEDTEGCILIGDGVILTARGMSALTDSAHAYRDFYHWVCQALDRGESCRLRVEEKLLEWLKR